LWFIENRSLLNWGLATDVGRKGRSEWRVYRVWKRNRCEHLRRRRRWRACIRMRKVGRRRRRRRGLKRDGRRRGLRKSVRVHELDGLKVATLAALVVIVVVVSHPTGAAIAKLFYAPAAYPPTHHVGTGLARPALDVPISVLVLVLGGLGPACSPVKQDQP